MRAYRTAIAAGLIAAGSVLFASDEALAQGKGHGAKGTPPGHAKKKVTADDAIVVTREVLAVHGYEVLRVEVVEATRVVYYRRGNMGKGKGKGPIEKIVIRPEPDRVVFVSQPPKAVMLNINVRLGL